MIDTILSSGSEEIMQIVVFNGIVTPFEVTIVIHTVFNSTSACTIVYFITGDGLLKCIISPDTVIVPVHQGVVSEIILSYRGTRTLVHYHNT